VTASERVPATPGVGFRTVWQRLRYGPRTLVLAYHRIAPSDEKPEDDPLGLAVRAHHFEEHLEVLRSFGGPVRFDRLMASTKDRTEPKESVCITFDDGYADNLHRGKPLLEKFDVPATVFVTSGQIGSGREFPWDGDSPMRPTHAVLSLDELMLLARSDLIEIGGHTAGHPSLPSLPEEDQRQEIVSGKRWLEEVLDRSIVSFAYPFGHHDARTVSLVREAGFRQACTVEKGAAWARTDPWRIPRLLARDQDGDDLARRLRRWFARPPATSVSGGRTT